MINTRDKYIKWKGDSRELAENVLRLHKNKDIVSYFQRALFLLNSNKCTEIFIIGKTDTFHKAVELAEMVKQRIVVLHQINVITTEAMQFIYEPLEEGLLEVVENQLNPSLIIKLTYNPSQQEIQMPGYQHPSQQDQNNQIRHIEYSHIDQDDENDDGNSEDSEESDESVKQQFQLKNPYEGFIYSAYPRGYKPPKTDKRPIQDRKSNRVITYLQRDQQSNQRFEYHYDNQQQRNNDREQFNRTENNFNRSDNFENTNKFDTFNQQNSQQQSQNNHQQFRGQNQPFQQQPFQTQNQSQQSQQQQQQYQPNHQFQQQQQYKFNPQNNLQNGVQFQNRYATNQSSQNDKFQDVIYTNDIQQFGYRPQHPNNFQNVYSNVNSNVPSNVQQNQPNQRPQTQNFTQNNPQRPQTQHPQPSHDQQFMQQQNAQRNQQQNEQRTNQQPIYYNNQQNNIRDQEDRGQFNQSQNQNIREEHPQRGKNEQLQNQNQHKKEKKKNEQREKMDATMIRRGGARNIDVNQDQDRQFRDDRDNRDNRDRRDDRDNRDNLEYPQVIRRGGQRPQQDRETQNNKIEEKQREEKRNYRDGILIPDLNDDDDNGRDQNFSQRGRGGLKRGQRQKQID